VITNTPCHPDRSRSVSDGEVEGPAVYALSARPGYSPHSWARPPPSAPARPHLSSLLL